MSCLPCPLLPLCAAKNAPVAPDGRFDQDDARVRYLCWRALQSGARREPRPMPISLGQKPSAVSVSIRSRFYSRMRMSMSDSEHGKTDYACVDRDSWDGRTDWRS